uniref:Alpha-carbonic anhydrase domain-containing protein n=1 Tax=Caenorhabditis japonica TaxID=281687 RepID=A0A8R1IQX3_CAEJA
MIPWLLTACIYPCVIGPDFWGLLHGDWRMCTAGQMQSPVNIDPAQLLYDPHLMPISIDGNIVEGVFENTGQLPVVTIKDSPNRPTINITGGPTMPYRYKLHQVSVHFGRGDEGEKGSEHTVDRVRFPAEIQLLAYNSDLYANFTVAMTSPRGLLAVSVIIDVGKTTSTELRRLTVASQSLAMATVMIFDYRDHSLSRAQGKRLDKKTFKYLWHSSNFLLVFLVCWAFSASLDDLETGRFGYLDVGFFV